ncbi:hypothetical protein [Levilactobacillus lindianensis]|uniref:hypothetical protein n=1 Tax=Levilactobacillus lindianensis TaxID=2486018 RepID=UPI000F739B95|nr:hypothetical protein [Levilactobacillus lindianensis]
MSKDFAVGTDNDIQIDPENGDLIMAEDVNQSEAYRVALGTNEGELVWNEGFGLNHLSLLSEIDNQPAMEAEISDYLESHFDTFVSAEITGITRAGRTATVSLKIVTIDDNGNEQSTDTGMEVETDGFD